MLNQRTAYPANNASAAGRERHRASRAELRQRHYRADLRDAMREAQALIHYAR